MNVLQIGVKYRVVKTQIVRAKHLQRFSFVDVSLTNKLQSKSALKSFLIRSQHKEMFSHRGFIRNSLIHIYKMHY